MLPLYRYRFSCRVERPLQTSQFAGSMLRGLFGHTLRRLCCVTGQQKCSKCLLYRHCNYAAIFETPPPEQHRLQSFNRIPAPFVIEPPDWGDASCDYRRGDRFDFSMVLIGKAQKQLPLIITTWQQALREGVGRSKGGMELEAVYYQPAQGDESLIYNTALQQPISEHPYQPPEVDLSPTSVRLLLQTPLRIQKQGKALKSLPTAADLLTPLIRRFYLLEEFFGHDFATPDFSDLKQQALELGLKAELQWQDLFRYSNRQKAKTPLGGLLGTIELSGDLAPFLDLIHLGQWFHLGNKASFGLGRYSLVLDSQ